MGLVIHFFQLLESGVRVDFCCGQAFVSEQFLDGLQVCLVVEHCCGEGVTQDVRAVPLLCGDEREVLLDDCADADGFHLPPGLDVEEEAWVCRCLLLREVFALAEIAAEAVAVLVAVGDDALFVALACHLELHLVEVDVLFSEAYELGESYACGVEREQNHAVADAFVVVGEEIAVEQTVHFCFADVGGQSFLCLRPWQVVDGVFRDESSPEQELVEGAEGAEPSAHACGGVALVHHFNLPLPHDVWWHFCPAEAAVCGFIEPLERFQVGFVFIGRPAGVVPLVPKVIYEVFYPVHALRIEFSTAKVAVFSDNSKRMVKNLRTFNLLSDGASARRRRVPWRGA